MALIRHFFITGTDTDCGKTLVTQGFMQLCKQHNMTVAGMKPVASGGTKDTQGGILKNDDATAIQLLCSHDTPYTLINPYCFEPPVAPHLAADMSHTRIDSGVVQSAFDQLSVNNECLIVEGVGGWRVPLNDELDISGLCRTLQLPAVLVVNMKLGCINHALLSAQAIVSDGVPLVGWVANCADPKMRLQEQNISTLLRLIPAPLLGTIPFLSDPSPTTIANNLNMPGPNGASIT